jgi:hypothetical protein
MTVVSTKSTVYRRAPGGRHVKEDQAVLAAACHLTERDRYLVRLTGQHRVLTTDQLCALGFDSIITARHRLGVLVSLGVLRRFRPSREVGSAPWHYLLGPVGAALLGAEDRDDRRWVPQVCADRQLALERSQQLAHLTGRNWFFVALARHARHGGGAAAGLAERGRVRRPLRQPGAGRLRRPGAAAPGRRRNLGRARPGGHVPAGV